ncbi:MAG: hypothetical protein JST12_03545 [Armatimonadetes bacterium]|nr:hypothetical protein [Armatimonadota bacterium]
MRIVLTFGLLFGAAMARAQAPLCLVGQPPAVNGSAILDLANPMANEIDAVGQLHCLTYSVEDPTIRDAFLAGKITKPEKFYKLDDLLSAARTLNVPYVIWIEGQNSSMKVGNASQKVLSCHATLYRGGRKIWDETDSQSVSISGDTVTDATIRACASSLTVKMQNGPLKGFDKFPKGTVPTDNIGKGQAPIIPESSDDDPVLNDWTVIKESVKNLISDGKLTAAEMLLRDAVDAAPNDVERRKALIDFLQGHQQVDAAVKATVDAAEALGDPSMMAQAAKILIESGQVDRASEIIKDSIASDPNNAAMQIMEAELRMRAAMPDQAITHLEAALKVKPTVEGYYLRAICRALLGSEDGVRLDLERVVKDDARMQIDQYGRMAAILDSAWTYEAPDLRTLAQKTELKPKAEEVADGIDAQERMAKACIALLGETCPNPTFEKSHGIRLLALNLLIQSLTELRHYISSGDKQSLNDANFDIGETVRNLADAKAQFEKESKDAATSPPPR